MIENSMEPASEFDVNELFQEAQSRWLKPAEIFFILQNYDRNQLAQEAPQNPQSGSLFLFNRKVTRFFRKDGWSWRKKKDGRTVGEAHERLKVRGVEALNCYYAHGEPNSSFQRRCYWMLDPDQDHIVLVHYREVSKGKHLSSTPAMLSKDFGMQNVVYPSRIGELSADSALHQSSPGLGNVHDEGLNLVMGSNKVEHLDTTLRSEDLGSALESEAWAFRRLTEQLSLDDEDDNQFVEKVPEQDCQNVKSKDSVFLDSRSDVTRCEAFATHGGEFGECGPGFGGYGELHDNLNTLQNPGNDCRPLPSTGFPLELKRSLSWKDVLAISSGPTVIDFQERNSDGIALDFPDTSTSQLVTAEDNYYAKDIVPQDNHLILSEIDKTSVYIAHQPENFTGLWQDNVRINVETLTECSLTSEGNNNLQLSAAMHFPSGHETGISSSPSNDVFQESEKSTTGISGTGSSETNHLTDILGETNSMEWLESRNMPVNNNLYSPDYYHMLLHQESCFRTPIEPNSDLAVLRFRILEISPEWAYSTENTKVVIVGDFLCNASEYEWACMFDDIEVPVEIIHGGVLRCFSPKHVAGKVALRITCGNRESCSEVRDFEYRTKPKTADVDNDLSQIYSAKGSEELQLLVRFVGTLLVGHDIVLEPLRKSETAADFRLQVRETLSADSETPGTVLDLLLQELLKDKLQQWISFKFDGGEGAGYSLSRQEKGIIHMIAGLGYEWALSMILNAGIGINFRDENGWTALHWAAHFGGEKMVVALLTAGASAGAVTDPTPQNPAGKNPAAIAADNGHKGLAGYLSEVALTSHLKSLTLEESENSKLSASMEAEERMKMLSHLKITVSTVEDELSLKDSIAAAHNVVEAASRIQAAFRAHSFRKKQLREAGFDDSCMSQDDIILHSAALTLQKAFRNCRHLKLNKAAVSIQKKYRGWIRRKEFLALKRNVVKIQAHVRGYQSRKKYKELLWMVGILEKAVLRWRRRGVGLRGFHLESDFIEENEEIDVVKIFRRVKVDAVVEEAVSRVLSMVTSSEARQQYRRLLEKYRQSQAMKIGNRSEAASSSQCSGGNMEKDDEIYMDDLVWEETGLQL